MEQGCPSLFPFSGESSEKELHYAFPFRILAPRSAKKLISIQQRRNRPLNTIDHRALFIRAWLSSVCGTGELVEIDANCPQISQKRADNDAILLREKGANPGTLKDERPHEGGDCQLRSLCGVLDLYHFHRTKPGVDDLGLCALPSGLMPLLSNADPLI